MSFLRSLTPLGKALLAIVLALALLAAFLFVRDLLTGTARTEAKLGTEQADAAIKSGQDTAQTVGNQSETEAERERSVAEMQKDVDNAEDTSGAHAAGAGWLCDDFGICS